jgi:hypothetical protein
MNGIKPAEEVNPNAVTVRPKHVCELQTIKFDMVIKMDVPERRFAISPARSGSKAGYARSAARYGRIRV